ncbi:hypothetical protein WK72_18930 [Burkholderia ubonensis]|uniref:hypothetical protein n=1 Tax=Burkholderia ubonensis TaxID=101571 RepID=UPI00075726E4|nr:hypothetical protein [Burkholderia ubonensis]KVU65295.1 hypothetical protein WK72_18930 [Burkholderia ubonensis]KWH16375.1 hypothetical protein WL97_14610 [Burkholderia ubonensis]
MKRDPEGSFVFASDARVMSSRADALTDDQRQALGEVISEYFGKLDSDEGVRAPDSRILRAFDYCDSRNIDDLIDRAIVPALAVSPAEQPTAAPIVELSGVRETLESGRGFWRTCSGCHESEDGHPVGEYPYSEILQCDLGSGCTECGGIGAIWDNTDYDDLVAFLDRQEETDETSQVATSANETGVEGTNDARRMRTLCRLLDAMDDMGNGFPGEVHAAFQDGGKRTRAALDAAAIPEDYACSPATAAAGPADDKRDTVPKWIFDHMVNTLAPAWDYVQTHQEHFNALAGDDKTKIVVEEFLKHARAAASPAAEAATWDKHRYGYQTIFNAICDAVKWREHGTIEISVEAFHKTMLSAAPQPAQANAPATIPDECAASGASCSYAPEGRHGEMQCRYCGKAQADAPAEAREPIEAKIAALIQPNPPGELGPTDEPESQYRLGYNTAIEDALIVIENRGATVRAPADAGEAVTAAARDALAERRRQVEAEGWTPEHDDAHASGELAMAGACYATTAVLGNVSAPMGWPWSDAWFKPTTLRRNLIKAAALIIAEIERIDRAAAGTGERDAS